MGPAEAMATGLEIIFRAIKAFFMREKVRLTISDKT
jgi:hypothetical protein